jgi:3-dehydroquinate synthetase
MALDKKVAAGKLRLVLLRRLGEGALSDTAGSAEVCAAIEACCHG